MFALVTITFKETFQVEGDVSLVVDVAIRVAVDLAAYHVGGR